MIFSDLKPNTLIWDEPSVEVCFTSSTVQNQFSTILKNLTPDGKMNIQEHSDDPDNMYTVIEFYDTTAYEYVKGAMKSICDIYGCNVLDY